MLYEGELVRLRPPERKECPLFVEWLQNPALRQFIGIRYLSAAMEAHWFDNLVEDMSRNPPGRLQFVIETLSSSQPIGVISLNHINWRDRDAEAGIIIGEPEFWGRGYGTDALHTLLHIGFRWYNLHRIHLYVVHDNIRAQRAYEKCGFQFEGRLRDAVFRDGQYDDLLLMSLLEGEF